MGMEFLEKLIRIFIPFYGTIYRRIGGQKSIGTLVDDFYLIMSTDARARECFLTHKDRDIKESGEKLKAFLSGWLGGPQLYLEKFGHPRLRMRHFPFAIGEKESEQWLYCMEEALKRSKIDTGTQTEMLKAFGGVINLVKNRD